MKLFISNCLLSIRKSNVIITDKMSSFVSSINPITGKSSWVIQDEKYDYHQEIARYYRLNHWERVPYGTSPTKQLKPNPL
jgi:hypothetical protein